MSGALGFFVIFYVTIAIVVMVGALWLDTLENPYAHWWDWHGWVLGAFLGATWPALALYWLWSLVTARRG